MIFDSTLDRAMPLKQKYLDVCCAELEKVVEDNKLNQSNNPFVIDPNSPFILPRYFNVAYGVVFSEAPSKKRKLPLDRNYNYAVNDQIVKKERKAKKRKNNYITILVYT